ncbi:MAG: MBL fold metallo-hydrolase, partial [Candidatus Omnitrophota bacterium]
MNKNAVIFEQLPLGPMNNFTYVIGDPANRNVGIADPGWDPASIIGYCQKKDYTIVALLLTHGHYDHTNAAKHILNLLPVPVYLSKHEPDYYRPDCGNIHFVDHEEEISIG